MSDQLPSISAFATLLGVALAVYLVLVVLAQLLRRTRNLRFSPLYHAFAVSAGLWVGLQTGTWTTSAQSALLTHVTAATLLLATAPVITLLNRALWVRTDKNGVVTPTPRVLELSLIHI